MNANNHCTRETWADREDRPVVRTSRATLGLYFSFEDATFPTGRAALKLRAVGAAEPIDMRAKFLVGVGVTR
jgi:hypothetical protein